MGNWASKGAGSATTKADYTLNIQYCGGWSYGPKAVYVKKYVAKEFGNKIAVVLKKDNKVTGNFELTVSSKKSGKSKLVHSKQNGEGFVNEDNLEALGQKLRDFCAS